MVGSLPNNRLWYALAVVAASSLGATPGPVIASVTVQDPGTYVVDRANIIAANYEQSLNAWLRELEQKTTAQVKVLTVPTLDGEPLFEFTQRHAELWKLGQKGKDNGVLILVALDERKDRIHVGYGLEGVLPDGWCGSLRRSVLTPYFKQGQFSEGLFRVVVSVANKIADDAKVTLTGMPKYRHGGRSRGRRVGGVACGGMFPFIMFILIVSSSRRGRHRGRWGGGSLMRGLFWGSVMGGMMRGGRSHWGGGGFGGGGFGGGFGGGSFGGGGGFGGGGAGGGGW